MIPRVLAALFCALTIAAPDAFAALPLAFERNLGQAGEGVGYISRGPSYDIHFAPDGVELAAAEGKVRMSWRGASPRARMHGRGPVSGTANYLQGRPEDWRTGIPMYAGVVYDGIYPGIDLAFYGSEGRLEYDFILHPGADPAVIRIAFEGIEGLRLENGDLVLSTAGGELRHNRPRIYQDGPAGRQEVGGEYRILGKREAGFRLSPYDSGRALVIDPVLEYSTFLGGIGDDRAWAIAVDASGCAYVAGETWSSNFPRTVTAGSRGNQDAFVVKLNAAGTGIAYATYFGGRSRDSARSIALDAAGNAYVAGFTYSSDFPATPGALRTTGAGQEDAFVVKLNASGKLTYSTLFGGTGSDFATGIAVDAGGNAYVAGYTSSVAFPVTANAAQKTLRGGFYDAFAAKLNSTGSALVYATYVGGSGTDMANAIAVDGSGFAHLAGFTDSADFPVRNAFRATAAGQGDGFVVKVNPGGDGFAYATYLGGSGRDVGNAIALDPAGNAYVGGTTASRDFPVTSGALQPGAAGGYDTFVTKLTAAGVVVYATYVGGTDTDEASALAVDAAGVAYVAGNSRSFDFPLVQPQQKTPGGRSDVVVFALNAAGTQLLYSTYLGGGGDDSATGIAWEANGSAVYIGGATMSPDFPVSSAAYARTSRGSADVFVSKIAVGSLSGSSLTPTGTGAVADMVFKVSDPNGATDVDAVYILINSSLAGPNACYLYLNASNRTLGLANDAADSWIVGPPIGESGSIQNSQCAVDLRLSSLALSGNTLTLSLRMNFRPVFSGTRNVYMLARNRASQETGWSQVGTWVVPANNPPTVTVVPATGSGPSGTLSFTVSDPDGAADVNAMYILINSSLAGPGGCYMVFDASNRQLWLATDPADGWVLGPPIGQSGTIQNSQCAVDVGASSVSLSGSNLTLKLSMVFKAAFAGAKNVYMLGRDRTMLDTGWRQTGTWTVLSGAQPPAVAVSPKTGSGATAMLNFIVTDAGGGTNVNAMYILINSSLAGPNACYLFFDVGSRRLLLASNDAGSWTAATLGSPGILQNSQCTVDVGTSALLISGNNATLSLNMTFQPAFAGTRNIYIYGRNQAMLVSGWQQVGTWIR